MLTPMDIHNREFKKGFRGYNEAEVDSFLDKVTADYEALFRENEKLKEQTNSNEKEIAQFRKMEKSLQDTLVVAQRTADELISAAKKNAEEMKENTKRECQNIREHAQIEARRQIDNANNKLKLIVAEYDRLAREKNAFLIKLRTALDAELALTTQILNNVPHPDNMDINVPPNENNEIKIDPEALQTSPQTSPESTKVVDTGKNNKKNS